MPKRSRLFSICFAFVLASCGLLDDGDKSRDKSLDDIGANVDLKAEELSPHGCLDLSLITDRLITFPESVLIRKYTTSFSIAPVAMDGYPVARLRNLAAESALASFVIDEHSPLDYSENAPLVRQHGCAKLEFENSSGAKDVYEIDASASSETQLVVQSANGKNKRTYVLTGPRRLEIIVTAPKIDRCPEFQKVMSTSTYILEWGAASEIRNRPVRIAADYLRQMAVAVEIVPTEISRLLALSAGGFVESHASLLQSLKTASLDPQITRCPFLTQAPVADEPPPPEEDPAEAQPGVMPQPEIPSGALPE